MHIKKTRGVEEHQSAKSPALDNVYWIIALKGLKAGAIRRFQVSLNVKNK
jgi:hypothetical protein